MNNYDKEYINRFLTGEIDRTQNQTFSGEETSKLNEYHGWSNRFLSTVGNEGGNSIVSVELDNDTNIITFTKTDGTTVTSDLTNLHDVSNVTEFVSATIDGNNVVFVRENGGVETVDFSAFKDNVIESVTFDNTSKVIKFTKKDGTTIEADLTPLSDISDVTEFVDAKVENSNLVFTRENGGTLTIPISSFVTADEYLVSGVVLDDRDYNALRLTRLDGSTFDIDTKRLQDTQKVSIYNLSPEITDSQDRRVDFIEVLDGIWQPVKTLSIDAELAHQQNVIHAKQRSLGLAYEDVFTQNVGYIKDTAQDGTPFHVKLGNLKLDSNQMFRFDFTGYVYGAGLPLDITIVGYPYQGQMLNYSATFRAGSVPISETEFYTDQDGFVYFKFKIVGSDYYTTFRVDHYSVGNGQPIKSVDIVKQADKVNQAPILRTVIEHANSGTPPDDYTPAHVQTLYDAFDAQSVNEAPDVIDANLKAALQLSFDNANLASNPNGGDVALYLGETRSYKRAKEDLDWIEITGTTFVSDKVKVIFTYR